MAEFTAVRGPVRVISVSVNNQDQTFDGDPSTPLLWVLRDHLQLTGTKFGCGIGQCGACTVHVDGRAMRSCMTPIAAVAGKQIRTIEDLAPSAERLHPVQRAWLEQDVPQCGYCQAGQIMAATDFLTRYPQPTDDDIDRELTNLCRCGTYLRIRQAVHRAAKLMAQEADND